ncbi:MAG: hypothetical protein ABI599_03170 [Flavobacteriales bacterium]
MTVGTFCCDDLTGTNEASTIMRQMQRRERFISSPQWRTGPDGEHIKRSQMHFRISADQGGFRLYVQGHRAREVHASLEEAKSKIFELIDDGTAHKVLKERGIPLARPTRKAMKELEVLEGVGHEVGDTVSTA